MLTSKQLKWIAHLSDKDKVVIKPYDPTTAEKFEAVKKRIRSFLGDETQILHRGATNLGISGQDEIDVYIPITTSSFDSFIQRLTELFGKPKSYYIRERARFVTIEQGKHVDVFLINKDSDAWGNGIVFEDFLKKHPSALEKYKKLKEEGNGLSVREYYRRKIIFINYILKKAK